MLSFLDCIHTCKSTLGLTCKEISRLPSLWLSVWRFIVVEMGPRRWARDPKVQKSEKEECGAGQGKLVWGNRPSGLGREKIAAEEGQGRRGLKWEKGQEGRTKESSMPQLWW